MNITVLGIILGLLPALLPLYVLYALGAKSFRPMAIGAVRMVVQLALVALYLFWLFKADSVWLSALWLLVMVLVAVALTLPRARLRPRLMLLPVAASVLVSTLVVGFYLLLAVVQADDVLAVRWLVPVMGALLAIESETCPLVLREYFVGLSRFSSTYYFHLGNGYPWWKAVMPMLSRAFDRGLMRMASRMTITGLVMLPLLLTGLLLGGADVLSAVVATAAILFGGLCASVLTVVLVIIVSHRLIIDKRGKLSDVVRMKAPQKEREKGTPQAPEGDVC